MLVLNQEELEEVTKRKRKSAQIEVLKRLNIPFRVHPDGVPIVLKAALEACLGWNGVTPTRNVNTPKVRCPKQRA